MGVEIGIGVAVKVHQDQVVEKIYSELKKFAKTYDYIPMTANSIGMLGKASSKAGASNATV